MSHPGYRISISVASSATHARRTFHQLWFQPQHIHHHFGRSGTATISRTPQLFHYYRHSLCYRLHPCCIHLDKLWFHAFQTKWKLHGTIDLLPSPRLDSNSQSVSPTSRRSSAAVTTISGCNNLRMKMDLVIINPITSMANTVSIYGLRKNIVVTRSRFADYILDVLGRYIASLHTQAQARRGFALVHIFNNAEFRNWNMLFTLYCDHCL